MSDYLHRLQIPPGKASYTLRETVQATALAMHPHPSGEMPVQILSIDKTVFQDGDPLRPSRPVAFADDDADLLRIIWSRLDPPEFPMPASQWKVYQEAFDTSRNRPANWGISKLQRDPSVQAELMRAATLHDHERELKDAIRRGTLTPRNVMTGIKDELGVAPLTDDWFLPLSAFKEFCSSLLIEAVDMRVFTTSARPVCVDPALLAMAAGDTVEVRETIGGVNTVWRGPVGDYIKQLTEQLERQAEGFFSVAEAAQVLADARPGNDVKNWISRIENATLAGSPIVLSADDRLPLKKGQDFLAFHNLVRVASLNDWLRQEKAGYLFPDNKPNTAEAKVVVPDPQRRLAALRALGGDVKWWKGDWKITCINALEKQERGNPRCSQKTIRKDLIEAAESEKREGRSVSASASPLPT